MDTLHIEWKHLEKDGQTCARCAATGTTLKRAIEDLTGELATRGMLVTFTETRLTGREIAKSNVVLFNGVPLEDLLPGVQVIENHCDSCADLCGENTSCRAVRVGGITYEAIPEFMIRQAGFKAAGIQASVPVVNEPEPVCCACCE